MERFWPSTYPSSRIPSRKTRKLGSEPGSLKSSTPRRSTRAPDCAPAVRGSTAAARAPPSSVRRPITTQLLLVEPGEEQPHAQPVAVVVAEALHVGGVRDVLRPLRRVHVVRLVREIALDVVDDL